MDAVVAASGITSGLKRAKERPKMAAATLGKLKRDKPPPPLEFSPETVEECRDLFNLFDKDGGGAVDAKEFEAMLKTLGLRMNGRETAALFNEMDTSGDGEIEFDEFMTVLKQISQPLNDEQSILKAFKYFDVEKTGKIRPEDLWRVMGAMDEEIALTEAEIMLKGASKSGNIDFEQFVEMLSP